MAAASYSSDVLQRFYGPIDEANQSLSRPSESPTDVELEEIIKLDEVIQNLAPEIREKIKNELVAIKIRERNEKGWNEVHDEIEEAPFCEKRQIITKVCYCRNCVSCLINGRCYECIKKGETHYLDAPYPTFETYNKNFQNFF